jgi:hypothetical protein
MPFDFSTPFAIFVQCIGFVAMAFGIGSYQAKKRSTIILIQTAGCLLWATQFILLGQWTGAILNLISILRGVIYAEKEKLAWARTLWVPGFFAAAYTVAGILTVPGMLTGTVTLPDFFLSLLPVCAMILSSFALYVTRENLIRILCFFCSPPWLIYDLIVGSVAGACTEGFVMVSILIALILYRNRSNTQNT